MKFIIGKKIEMTQVYDEFDEVIPVTRVGVTPCFVSQVKTKEKDGYEAVQLAGSERKKINKPQVGHLKDLKKFGVIREFRVDEAAAFKKGQEIKVDIFEKGDLVDVAGLSKGKGFQGVMRRHHFSGSKATHGNKDQSRMPGAIGSGRPQHVIKGKRMAGRMGYDMNTLKNLTVISVEPDNNIIYLKGAVPGARNETLLITGTGRKAKVKVLPASEAEKEPEKGSGKAKKVAAKK